MEELRPSLQDGPAVAASQGLRRLFPAPICHSTPSSRRHQHDHPDLRAAAGAGFSTATDLADWLVRRLGLPFREAHHVTGALVKAAETRGIDLAELDLAAMRAVHPGIGEEVYEVLGIDRSVASRTSYGGTAPLRVREQVRRWQAALG
jgi:argininosuccinate lyase